MTKRAVEIVDFLASAGWDAAEQLPLQADFSTRRFARLWREEGPVRSAILMDADSDQGTEPFVAIAGLLRACGMTAPEIYAAHVPRGLVLMEDFGDRNFGRMIDAGEDARPLYRRAVDRLIHLHKNFDPASARNAPLPVFDAQRFADQVQLFLDGYFILVHERPAGATERADFSEAWAIVLKPVNQLPRTLMLRDFMSDNLMHLDGKADEHSTGILDFQDGGLGPAAYDLASLFENVRRDGGGALLDEFIDYYVERAAPHTAKNDFRGICRLLAAQRHTRIIGIIARLALQTGRRDKLAYLPRIWSYLGSLLKDPRMRPVEAWMNAHIPPAMRGPKE